MEFMKKEVVDLTSKEANHSTYVLLASAFPHRESLGLICSILGSSSVRSKLLLHT